MTSSDLTRAELVEHMRQRRVVVDFCRGDRAHVTVTFERRTWMGMVPRDWIKPLLDPSAGRQGRA